MKVLGLDGREYKLDLRDKRRLEDETRVSSYHLAARELLKDIFPNDHILEEIFLPGCKSPLYADFFLRLRRIVVEVQGEQHYRRVKVFQPDRLDFLRGKGRDGEKKRWCEVNSLSLVELPYMEDAHVWRRRILEAHGN